MSKYVIQSPHFSTFDNGLFAERDDTCFPQVCEAN